MTFTLALLCFVIVVSAAIAVALRNLIHSALLLVATWTGIAGFYLWAGAEFAAFAQVLVYVGAISMVVLFAVLLTRRSHLEPAPVWAAPLRRAGAASAALAMFALLSAAVLRTSFAPAPADPAPSVTVRQLGTELMGPHGAAVIIVGALLTVALLGAVVLAATDATGESS